MVSLAAAGFGWTIATVGTASSSVFTAMAASLGFIDAIANAERNTISEMRHEFISETAHHEARSFWRAIRLL